MDKVLVVDNPLVTVWVYPDKGIIHHQMKAFCHGAAFREALTKGGDAMRQHRATKWLSDDRMNGVLPKADEDWGMAAWLPRVRAFGWKHWAIVQPAKVLGQINMKRHMQKLAELGIIARMFADPDEAMTWLEAQ